MKTVMEILLFLWKIQRKELNFVMDKDPGYFSWILNADFPRYTKNILNKIRLSKINNKLS